MAYVTLLTIISNFRFKHMPYTCQSDLNELRRRFGTPRNRMEYTQGERKKEWATLIVNRRCERWGKSTVKRTAWFDTLFYLCWMEATACFDTMRRINQIACLCAFMLCACLFQFSIVIQSDFYIEFSAPFGINCLFLSLALDRCLFAIGIYWTRWKIPIRKSVGRSGE